MSGSYFYKEQEDKYDYIQVSDNITLPETFRREADPLLKIKNACPKMVNIKSIIIVCPLISIVYLNAVIKPHSRNHILFLQFFL